MLITRQFKTALALILVVAFTLPEIVLSKRTKEQWDQYYKDAHEYRESYRKFRDNNKGFAQMSLSEIFEDKDVCKLAKAASKCQLDKIEKLLDQGTDINAKGLNGITPLTAGLNCYKAFLYMLERGANPNAVFYSGGAIMTLAAQYPTPEFLLAALKHGGDPNIITGGEPTNPNPLITAIVHKNWESVDVLLEHGADINQWTPLGGNAGLTAARSGHFELFYRLLQMGLKYDKKNKYGDSILEALGYGEYNMLCGEQRDPYFDKIDAWLSERGTSIPKWRPDVNICPRLAREE